MPRTIDEVMADLPPAQQKEIERRYHALRRTVPFPQRDKAPDDQHSAKSIGPRLPRRQ
jgi:hypothetical protein